MTILFDATRPVKSSRPFGAGLEAPARPARHDSSDEAWWAAHSPLNRDGYDVVSRPIRAIDCPENRIRPRCPSERLYDGNADYIDRRVWAMGHDA